MELAFRATYRQLLPQFPLKLPGDVLQRILKYLLVSTKPVILELDAETPAEYAPGIDTAILRSCCYVSRVGTGILYSLNTFTTSSPATSANFAQHLLKLPGRHLQLIRYVKLDIVWANELWNKFPLIARVLSSIRGLKSLEITITAGIRNKIGKGKSASTFRPMGIQSDSRRHEEAMLNVEKKVLKQLVSGLHALKNFKLQGFADKKFARDVEVSRNIPSHCCSRVSFPRRYLTTEQRKACGKLESFHLLLGSS